MKKSIFQQILGGVSFYKKQFLLFLVLGFVALTAGIIISYFRISALTLSQDTTVSGPAQNIDIQLTKEGKLKINNKLYRPRWERQNNFDEITFKIIDQPGYYINQIIATIHLPKEVSTGSIKGLYELPPRTKPAYLTPPLQGTTGFIQQDSQTLIYSGTGLSPDATYTVVIRLPKGTINFPWWEDIYFSILHLPFVLWIALAIIIPGFCWLVLVFLLYVKGKQQRVKMPAGDISAPPSRDPPAIIGALYTGRVGSREIVATLIDLAYRGHLIICRRRQKDFMVLRRQEKTLDVLHPFEEMLLSKLFYRDQFITHREDIERRIGGHIFSRRIADVYGFIYQEATASGYFIQNPALIHARWKLTGILLFISSLVGFGLAAIFAPTEAKFSLFLWVAMMICALMIVRFALYIPLRTDKGKKVLGRFLAFKNYLTSNEPIDYWAGLQEGFEKYLPYAIVFGCEKQWSNRFMKHPFDIPIWFESRQKIVSIEDFQRGIWELLGNLAKQLHASHEPTVD